MQIYKLSVELADQKKDDLKQKLSEAENTLLIFNTKYQVMAQEHNAMKDSNKYLENKMKEYAATIGKLTNENGHLVRSILDLKEKQVEKLNQANDLIKEVNDMKHMLQSMKPQKSTSDLKINTNKEELKQSEGLLSLTPKYERSQTEVIPSTFKISDFEYFSADITPSFVS